LFELKSRASTIPENNKVFFLFFPLYMNWRMGFLDLYSRLQFYGCV